MAIESSPVDLGLPQKPHWRLLIFLAIVTAAATTGVAFGYLLYRIDAANDRQACRALFADQVTSAQVDGQIATARVVDDLANRLSASEHLKANAESAERLDAARDARLAYGRNPVLPCPLH